MCCWNGTDADPLVVGRGLRDCQLGSDVWWEIFSTSPWTPAVGPTKLVSPFSLLSISSFFSRLLLLGMGMILLSTLAWLRL